MSFLCVLRVEVERQHPMMALQLLVLIVCVCVSVCLSATALAGATRTLRAQLRHQQKALVTRIKNVGIGLKHLSSKVMTVCSSPRIL